MMQLTTIASMFLSLCVSVLLLAPSGADAGEAGLSVDGLTALAEKRKAEDFDLILTAKEMLKKADKSLEHKDAEIIVILAVLHGATDAAKAVLRFGSEKPEDIARGLIRAGQSGVEVVHTMKYLKFKVREIAGGMLIAGAPPEVVVSGLVKTKVPLAKIVGFLKRGKIPPAEILASLLRADVALEEITSVSKTYKFSPSQLASALHANGNTPEEIAQQLKKRKLTLKKIQAELSSLGIEVTLEEVESFIE